MAIRDVFRFGRGARREFEKQSADRLYRDLPASTDVAGAVRMAGGRRELAEQLSGTTDRRSRAYRNARDYISRHLRGSRRRVNPGYERKIGDVMRSDRRREIRQRGSMNVEVTADIRVSKGGRAWNRGRMRANLSGQDLRDYLDAVERGDAKGALGVFLEAYGLPPEKVAEVNTIHDVSYTY